MKTPTVAGTDEGRNERAITGETGTETAREGTNTDNLTGEVVLRAVNPSASQLTSATTDRTKTCWKVISWVKMVISFKNKTISEKTNTPWS